MNIVILNIFTGGKGGIGKTLCALCCSTYYLTEVKNSHVNVCDLNFSNTDLFKILYGKSLEENDVAQDGFIIKDIGRNILESKIICKKRMYEIPNGNLGIWKDIAKTVELSKNCNNLIIDMNINTASLLDFTNNPEEAKAVSDIIASSSIDRIRIWLVWSFNILSDIAIKDRIVYENSIKSFDEISKGKFLEKRDLIHVLNPYKFFREDEYGSITSLVNILTDKLRDIISVVNSNDVNNLGEIGVTYYQMVTNFVKAFKNNPRDIVGAFKDLSNAIQESSKYLPFNVCFVPFYIKKPSVQNYIENLSSKPPTGDMNSLIKPVYRIYGALRNFISTYDQVSRG